MKHLSYFVLTFALALPVQGKAYSGQDLREAYRDDAGGALLLVFATVVIVATPIIMVGLLVENREKISEDRKGKYGLFEGGMGSNYGRTYSLGAFLNDDSLIVGRYASNIEPDAERDYKSYEVGYRHYYQAFFGEVGLFHALHRDADTYRFDAYKTDGAFASLGMAAQFWRLTLGIRAIYYKGLSTHSRKTFENSFDVGERRIKEARDRFNERKVILFEGGVAI